MGNLSRFDLERMIKNYKVSYLFETGTLWGDGVAYALQFPFKKIVSVEIMPSIAEQARKRFSEDQQVAIIETDSVTALKEQLGHLTGNIVFWLDAHFPGADAGLEQYDKQAEGKDDFRLPLSHEIEIISTLRSGFQDVLIIDDLRIYENGPYQNGNVPPDAMPAGERSIRFVEERFSGTHVIIRSYLDEGYLLLFPKKSYKKHHGRLARFFHKKDVENCQYLAEPGTSPIPAAL